MNSNRGQYTSAPLHNMKNRRSPSAQTEGEQPSRQTGSRRFRALSIVLSVGLPVLFLLSLLIPNNTLRWFFLIAVGLSLAMMWLLGAFVRNARSTLTIVYGALAVVIGLALFMNSQAPEARNVSSSRASQGALFADQDSQSLGAMLTAAETPEPTVDPLAAAVSAAQQQLNDFMAAWAVGDIPTMLRYCVPSWVSAQQSPETTLWQLISNSRPVDYKVESVDGSDGDTSRIITLRVTLNKNNGTEPSPERMRVVMMRVNTAWYVDPQSLNGTAIDEAAEDALKNVPMIATTIAPTATPNPNGGSGITLYYNKDGGKYYHAVRNCSAVAEKYWPLDEFSYDDLNSQQFKNLVRCPTCNPPERPSVR